MSRFFFKKTSRYVRLRRTTRRPLLSVTECPAATKLCEEAVGSTEVTKGIKFSAKASRYVRRGGLLDDRS